MGTDVATVNDTIVARSDRTVAIAGNRCFIGAADVAPARAALQRGGLLSDT